MKTMAIEKMMKQKNLTDDYATYHADVERKRRLFKANNLINKEHATLCDSFKVDCGHKNGAEIHNVYSNGIIKIYNLHTRKLITTLIANPNQVIRYYDACRILKTMPQDIILYCKKHNHKVKRGVI